MTIGTTRTGIWFTATLVLTSLSAACRASRGGPSNVDHRGVAIRGFDPVAYFTQGKAIPGSATHSHRWQEATWHFASAEHLDLFVAEPSRYAPRYGGYCAWAVSQGYTADVDPQVWKIVDGRLYLNHDERVRRKWEANQADSIRKADIQWPKIRAELDR